jgi:hypothetical protein
MSSTEEQVVSDRDADRALKAKHRALWASGTTRRSPRN